MGPYFGNLVLSSHDALIYIGSFSWIVKLIRNAHCCAHTAPFTLLPSTTKPGFNWVCYSGFEISQNGTVLFVHGAVEKKIDLNYNVCSSDIYLTREAKREMRGSTDLV